MKSIVVTIATVSAAAAVLLATPAVSFAQSSNSTVTRAQVRQELLDLESVGYNTSSGDGGNYPEDILAAQDRLTAKRLADSRRAEAAYGPAGAPGTHSGAPAVAAVKP
ncbi:DUF4148 domain-containing protein [Burkholderia sp. Ac-20353]|uniref:DUF4148 domain-containing protein n=1 Tax=Burkholderia sp. Ac-20353 TaxID=2703894 RepID=UPI00197BA194|nr:DUF4148 domain-containing protein [Burkholderia sp. Ac-20353]MBN3789575.1 DUF4148 domain-containing protein [Burkholderia sp. Ac-20353]